MKSYSVNGVTLTREEFLLYCYKEKAKKFDQMQVELRNLTGRLRDTTEHLNDVLLDLESLIEE